MSLHFAKLQKKYKDVVKENAELRERDAQHESEKARIAQEHAQAAVAPVRAELERVRDGLQVLEAQLAATATEKQLLANIGSTLDEQLSQAQQAIRDLVADRDAWKAKYEAQAPALLAARQEVVDLAQEQQQLDDLRVQYEQVTRNATARERERIAAIENRKALASAVPGRNRG